MNKKRLIFTLLADQGQFQLSRNFSRQKVGDLNWLINSYHAESIFRSIDELIILNTSNTFDTFNVFIALLKDLSSQCFMPIAAGGGIKSLSHAKEIFQAGADKIVLNTTLFSDPSLVHEIAKNYGKQSIVGSLDYKIVEEHRRAFIEGGQTLIEKSFTETIKYIASLPIGELYITSMDRDGTGRGYDLETLELIQEWVDIPIIASGGVGKFEHLFEGMQVDKVTGVSTANLFNFIGDGLKLARDHLYAKKVDLANWNFNELDMMINDEVII